MSWYTLRALQSDHRAEIEIVRDGEGPDHGHVYPIDAGPYAALVAEIAALVKADAPGAQELIRQKLQEAGFDVSDA